MAYHEKFKRLMNHEKFPKYDVYPVTEEPDIQRVAGEEGYSWVVALEPALDPPNDVYFLKAGLQNGVGVENLTGIRGDLAMFFRLLTREVSPEARERMVATMGSMAVLANVWEDTLATAQVLTKQRGVAEVDIW